jgi:hypothetical protein
VKIETLIGLLIILLMGALTAYVAWKRGRSPLIWFIVGIFFGWLGFLLVYFLPVQEEVLKQREEEVSRAQKIEPQNLEKQGLEKQGLEKIEPVQEKHAYEEVNWFYLDKERKQQGPISSSSIENLWKKQEIMPATYVWKEGMQDWKKVEELPGLIRALQEPNQSL